MRSVGMPIDHIEAEMAAFPIASEAAFKLSVVNINSDQRGNSGALWRETEAELIRSNPSVSVDEIIALRDRLWHQDSYAGAQEEFSLGSYLVKLANRYLNPSGGVATPRQPLDRNHGNDGREVLRARRAWKWLSFALPPDLVLGGVRECEPTVGVEVIGPRLNWLLEDHGFAETHLHFGAGLGFPLLWVATLNRLADVELEEEDFQSPGAVFDEGRGLAGWLIRAAIARYCLAAFLNHRNLGHQGDFSNFLWNIAQSRLLRNLSVLRTHQIEIAFRELAQGQHYQTWSPNFTALKYIYSQLAGIIPQQFPDTLDEAVFQDPINSFYPCNPNIDFTSEMGFMAAGLSYLEENTDQDFSLLFWQCVRVRALFYRHIVQRPMTPGLQWFIRHFHRIGPGRRVLSDQILVESSANACGLGKGLRSMEIRTCPGDTQSGNFGFLQQIHQTFESLRNDRRFGNHPSARNCEFGMVLHLAKNRGGDFNIGLPRPNWSDTHSDPRNSRNQGQFRYFYHFQCLQRQTTSLARTILNFPQSLQIFRGMDVCTDEIGVPTWVIAPMFRYLKDCCQAASSHLMHSLGWQGMLPRKTVHAGEDFVHLIGGLRSLSDSIQYLQLGEGDRIGHAVALGIDAGAWAKQIGRIAMTREQRMLDLVWEWICYTREHLDFEPSRRAWLEDEIEHLASTIFGDEFSIHPSDVVQLVEDLHSERLLNQVGYEFGREPLEGLHCGPAEQRLRLLYRYLTCENVFRKGHEVIVVRTDLEADAIERLQLHVRKRVAALGVTIEINPSSNLLIGNLGDLQNHPLWKLSPPIENGEPRLRVCIGSDDPLIFATTLREEYALLHDTLVLAGQSSDDADKWIDHVRESGLNSRFTLPHRDIRLSCPGPVWLGRNVRPILMGEN